MKEEKKNKMKEWKTHKSKYQKHKKTHYTPVILNKKKINEKKNIGII